MGHPHIPLTFLWPHGKPPAHLEVGTEIPFRDLLRMVKTEWPLTAFIGPADDSAPTPRRCPPVMKILRGNRHERRAAIAKARGTLPGRVSPMIASAQRDSVNVTHVGAHSSIGAQLPR